MGFVEVLITVRAIWGPDPSSKTGRLIAHFEAPFLSNLDHDLSSNFVGRQCKITVTAAVSGGPLNANRFGCVFPPGRTKIVGECWGYMGKLGASRKPQHVTPRLGIPGHGQCSSTTRIQHFPECILCPIQLLDRQL